MAEHATFHEPLELLSQAIMERHRAIVSLMEELEAVDWYDQRVEATTDDELALGHGAQPRRGEGARGDDARVAAPQRREVGRGAAHVPVHRRSRSSRSKHEAEARGADSAPSADGSSESAICEGNRRDEPPAPRARARPVGGVGARSRKRRRARCEHFLTARRLVDFDGPHGWTKERVTRGRVEDVKRRRRPGSRRRLRSVQPLARVPRRVLDGARRARRDRPGRARRRPRPGARRGPPARARRGRRGVPRPRAAG